MASLNEGSKRKDYGKKGGQGGTRSTSNTPFDRRESSANMQDPARRTKGGRKAPIPSWLTKPPKTVEQTPLNQYIRNQEDLGGRVSEPLKDTAGVRDAARRGQLKPVQAGGSKPTAPQGQISKVRLKGDLAASGVDTSPAPSQRSPRNVRLADTTKGGPVKTMRLGDPGAPSKDAARTLQRMTTASPEQTRALQDKLVKADTPKKPEPIKQSEVSKRAARFRQSFGTPTGADPRTGAPTYRPLDAMTDLPKGRGGRAPSPEQYGRTKVGDLDAKRILRTMGPKGEPTTRGVQNFALNRETQGRFSPSTRRGRTLSPADSKSAMDKVDRIMSDPKQVADIKGRIRQEVGGRRAQTTSPNPVPSRSTSASAASTRVIKRVQVKDITPPRTLKRAALPPASSPAPSTPPVRTTAPTVAPTKTKVELPKLKLTTAQSRPAQPKAPAPSFSVPGTTKQTKAPQLPPVGNTSAPAQPKTSPVKTDTPGQNLEFGKTKTGSFTYKPSTKAPATTATPAPAAPVAQLEPSASPTIRRRSGAAGPSSFLPGTSQGASTRPPSASTRTVTRSAIEPPKTVNPDLGSRSRTIRKDSVTYRPGDRLPSTSAGPVSMAGDALYGGLVGYRAYQKAKERGQSDAYAYKQAAAQGGTTTVASALGGAAGRRIGSKIPGPAWLKVGGAYAGDFLGSAAAGYLGQTASQGIVGASKSDKKWMQWANRSVQQGTAPKNATSRTGSRAVVRDANNKERVGYLAYKDGKPVYKHGNDPSSLQYTSSNPLERIGRTIGSSDSLGPVSNWFKGYYSRKDEATRKRDVAAQRTKAGN